MLVFFCDFYNITAVYYLNICGTYCTLNKHHYPGCEFAVYWVRCYAVGISVLKILSYTGPPDLILMCKSLKYLLTRHTLTCLVNHT